jgi:hypothetical protein
MQRRSSPIDRGTSARDCLFITREMDLVMLKRIKLTKGNIRLLRPRFQVCWPTDNWIDQDTRWESGTVYSAHPVRCFSTISIQVDGRRREAHKNYLYRELVPEIELSARAVDYNNSNPRSPAILRKPIAELQSTGDRKPRSPVVNLNDKVIASLETFRARVTVDKHAIVCGIGLWFASRRRGAT